MLKMKMVAPGVGDWREVIGEVVKTTMVIQSIREEGYRC